MCIPELLAWELQVQARNFQIPRGSSYTDPWGHCKALPTSCSFGQSCVDCCSYLPLWQLDVCDIEKWDRYSQKTRKQWSSQLASRHSRGDRFFNRGGWSLQMEHQLACLYELEVKTAICLHVRLSINKSLVYFTPKNHGLFINKFSSIEKYTRILNAASFILVMSLSVRHFM